MEGYVSTRLLLLAIKKSDAPPSREMVVDALEKLGKVDIGLGAVLELNKEQHQASHRVWPTVIRRGKVVPFEWDELGPQWGQSHE
jgi:hypothetical protein